MRLLFYFFVCFFYHFLCEATFFKKAKKSTHLLGGLGYTQVMFDRNAYNGFAGFTKVLYTLPVAQKQFFIGLGAKGETTISYSQLSTGQESLYYYTAGHIGLDFGYQVSFLRRFLFLLSPYFYFPFYIEFVRETLVTGSYIQAYINPRLNFNYGLGASLLWKIPKIPIAGQTYHVHVGPSVYYSWGYMSYADYEDSVGGKYLGSAGDYVLYYYGLSIGLNF
jgi:hypothetical protein